MTRRKTNSARLALTCGAAAMALIPVAMPAPAQAQALQPVVDVCTGITLPRSAVTEVIEAVNQPIVSQVENTVNGITTVTLILAPLATITDLNIDLSTILSDAAAGDPISLQVLDTDGNVLTASDDCNLAADNYTLNQEAGLAIGGNQITGLGADGQAASAGELDAIALGNNASTAVGAGGAIAIGTDASATASGSVALGAGSVADRANSVSVGSPGSERQVVNVATGTADTDAANVGQMNAAISAATADVVSYDDAAHGTVTFTGAGGTRLSNVAAGDVSASSSDAVNGSQLYATNQNVTALDGRVTQNETDIANLQASVGDQQTTINQHGDRITQNETDIADLDGRVTTNETNIANIDSRVTSNETNISNIDARVTTNETDIADIDTRVTTNETTITDIDNRVTVNEGDITTLEFAYVDLDDRVTYNTTTINNIQAQVANVPVGYVSDADPSMASATPTGTAALIGAGGGTVRLTNVQQGELSATSSDAVNGSQLYATNQTVAALDDRVTQNRTDIDRNAADITDIRNSYSGSTVAAVQYSDPSAPTASNGGTITNDATLVGANSAAPVALHNVADATGATDAVNLRQMQAGLDNVMAGAIDYTDLRIAQVGFDLAEVRKDSRAGTAGAMAQAGLPQTLSADRSMIAGAVGHYRGQTAFAIGVSSAIDEGRAVVRVNGSVDTNGNAGVSAGAGFSF